MSRMLKINEQSMASLAIGHFIMGIIFTSVGEFKMDRMYVDFLAGVSAISCACWPDNMSWFSIGMLFTHPLAGSLCIIHLCKLRSKIHDVDIPMYTLFTKFHSWVLLCRQFIRKIYSQKSDKGHFLGALFWKSSTFEHFCGKRQTWFWDLLQSLV